MATEHALVLVRLLHFTAVLLLLGTVVFQRRLAAADVAAAMAARLGRWQRDASVMALASAIAWLLVEAADASDGWAGAIDPATMLSLATEATFGWVWCLRIALAVLLVTASMVNWDSALEIGAVGLAFGVGWVGHGVILDGTVGWLLSIVLGAHVVAAGVWVGALPAVVACLWTSDKAYPAEAVAASLTRFSRLGHGAVVVVAVTGLLTARGILGDWPLNLSSLYRQLLAAKMLLIAVMIGLALINGYGLLPRIAAKSANAARWLTATATAEIILTGLVLALVAVFGNLSPMQ